MKAKALGANTTSREMKIEWDTKIGPASIVGAVGIIIQAVVVVWVGSSVYTKTVDKIDAQSLKIDEVEKGSNKRFELVHSAIDKSQSGLSAQNDRMTRVESAIGFIGDQMKWVVTRLDGATPPPVKP